MNVTLEKRLELLSEIIRISNSTQKIDARLEDMLELISSILDLKAIALYALDSHKGLLCLRASKHGTFEPSISTNRPPFDLLLREKRPCIFSGEGNDDNIAASIPEGDSLSGGGVFPVTDDKFFYGALILLLNEEERLDDEDISFIKPVSQEIAGTMRNARLYANTREVVEDLILLNDVWKKMSEAAKLESLLEVIINKVSPPFNSLIGMIKLHKSEINDDLRVCYNIEDERLIGKISEISDHVYLASGGGREVMILNHWDKLSEIEPDLLPDDAKSAMIAPIMDRSSHIGCMILIGEDKTFTDKEARLLSTISTQASAAINNALMLGRMEILNRENEKMVKELSNLFELNKAVMITINLNKLLHIILTAVTMGDGFGFNRAMLFLYNEKSGYIQGMMGVGPDNEEDAWRIWSDISDKGKTLQEILADEADEEPASMINEMVKGIRISVKERSITGLTVLEKRAYNIPEARNDPRVHTELLSKLGCRAFATAPLMASGRVVGVILVDNIYNKRPITDDDIRLLTVFANQAGVAIDNSILFRNLEEAHRELKETQGKLLHSEKLIALGEMAAGVAHEIRNPLVSIGGFARRLKRKIQDSDDSKYIDIICKEVGRLEKILNDILIFSRDEDTGSDTQDINRVLEESLQIFWSEFGKCGIEVTTDFQPGIDMVEINYHHLKQVFINLLSNAGHAMQEGGSLSIKSYQCCNEDNDGEDIIVEISDTGEGIPYSIITNIFNPFFTTKSEGTGLGLAITHKILTTCGGDIVVINNDEGGATFTITLPASKKFGG